MTSHGTLHLATVPAALLVALLETTWAVAEPMGGCPGIGVVEPSTDMIDPILSPTGQISCVTTNAYDAAESLYRPGAVYSGYGLGSENLTMTTYDGRELTSDTDASYAQITQSQYDSAGRVTEVTDANGAAATTQYTYDSRNNVLDATETPGGTIAYTYSGGVMQETETDPGSIVTMTQYDAMGRVSEVTDPAGITTMYNYDSAGDLTETTSSNGITVTYTYTAGQVTEVQELVDAILTTQYFYDYSGGVLATIDNSGDTAITTFQYDGSGNVVSATDSGGIGLYYADPVPEPASLSLLGAALIGLGSTRRRRRG